MHEIRIAQDLQKIILEAAVSGNLNKVTTVNLQFGKMVNIVPDIFRFAFEEATRNSVVEGANLIIEFLPVKIRCLHCLKESEILTDSIYECVNCGSFDVEITQGKELFIKYIEGE